MYFLGFFCPFLRFTSCIFGQTPTRRQTAQSALLDYSTELISKHILVFYLIAVTKLNNVDRFWNLIYINYTKLRLFNWHSIYALVFIYAKHILDDFLIIILNFKQSSSYSFFLTTKHWGWGTHTIVHTHTHTGFVVPLFRYGTTDTLETPRRTVLLSVAPAEGKGKVRLASCFFALSCACFLFLSVINLIWFRAESSHNLPSLALARVTACSRMFAKFTTLVARSQRHL